MKKIYSLIILTLALTMAGISYSNASDLSDPSLSTAGIDALDTVFFDLTNAIYSTNKVEVPVFIKSDDQIFALDFSTQFDLNKLTYDSLINLTPSLSPLAWYNANDSTLRMTSFSLSQLSNNTTLVHIRFTISAGQTLSEADFDVKNMLLNGEACSWYIIDPMNTSIPDYSAEINATRVFPNPCAGSFNIEIPFRSEFMITTLNGQVVVQERTLGPGRHNINVYDISAGVYFIEVLNDYFTVTRRIVIRD